MTALQASTITAPRGLGSDGRSPPATDGHLRLVPRALWRVMAIVCVPLYIFSAITALVYPELGPLFIGFSALIALCLLLVLVIERTYERLEQRHPSPARGAFGIPVAHTELIPPEHQPIWE